MTACGAAGRPHGPAPPGPPFRCAAQKAPPRAAGARRHQRRCCRPATLSFHARSDVTDDELPRNHDDPVRQTPGPSKARRTRLAMIVGLAARQGRQADRKDDGALGETQAERRAHGCGGSDMATPWPEQRGSAVNPPQDVCARCVKTASPRALARPNNKRATSGGGPRRQCAPISAARIQPRAPGGSPGRSPAPSRVTAALSA